MLRRSRYVLRHFRPFVRSYYEEASVIGSAPDTSSTVYQVRKCTCAIHRTIFIVLYNSYILPFL